MKPNISFIYVETSIPSIHIAILVTTSNNITIYLALYIHLKNSLMVQITICIGCNLHSITLNFAFIFTAGCCCWHFISKQIINSIIPVLDQYTIIYDIFGIYDILQLILIVLLERKNALYTIFYRI